MIHIHSDDCRALKDQLSEFIDGELDDALCEEIKKHMESCDNCRVMVDTLRKTVILYRDAPQETVPPDVHSRLVKVLDLEQLAKKRDQDHGRVE